MSYNYSKFSATALNLIKYYGTSVVWRQIAAAPSGEPWKGGAAVTTDHNVEMAFFPENRIGRESIRINVDSGQPEGAIVGFMGNVPFVPSTKDVVIRNGKELEIKTIQEIKPADLAVMYEVTFNL